MGASGDTHVFRFALEHPGVFARVLSRQTVATASLLDDLNISKIFAAKSSLLLPGIPTLIRCTSEMEAAKD